MEISSARHHHHQNLMAGAGGAHALEEVLACSKPGQYQPPPPPPPQQQPAAGAQAAAGGERKPRPHPDQALKCPRCDSTNTKFCYYNNYSLSQPRYFCKGCRRYWTQGGSLRNVPVGGGCRKNKRSSSSSSSSSSTTSSCSSAKIKVQEPAPQFHHPSSSLLLPSIATTFEHPSDHLTLAFATTNVPTSNGAPSGTFLDILRGGFLESSNNNSNNAGNAFQLNTYYGGDQEMVLPFDGYHSAAQDKSAMDHGEEEGGKVMMGLQWPIGGGGGDHAVQTSLNVSNVMDSSRDYWNGGVGTTNSWHGLINSSLM